MRGHRVLSGQRGFTLVETLAAFAILALSLIALFAASEGAARGTVRADFSASAVRLGQSLIETVGLSTPLVEGVTSGVFDNGAQWIMSITPYDNPISRGEARPIVGGEWVEVVVRSPASNGARPMSLALTTMKLTSDVRGLTREGR